jgi:hypothetical protein
VPDVGAAADPLGEVAAVTDDAGLSALDVLKGAGTAAGVGVTVAKGILPGTPSGSTPPPTRQVTYRDETFGEWWARGGLLEALGLAPVPPV